MILMCRRIVSPVLEQSLEKNEYFGPRRHCRIPSVHELGQDLGSELLGCSWPAVLQLCCPSESPEEFWKPLSMPHVMLMNHRLHRDISFFFLMYSQVWEPGNQGGRPEVLMLEGALEWSWGYVDSQVTVSLPPWVPDSANASLTCSQMMLMLEACPCRTTF